MDRLLPWILTIVSRSFPDQELADCSALSRDHHTLIISSVSTFDLVVVIVLNVLYISDVLDLHEALRDRFAVMIPMCRFQRLRQLHF